MIRSRILLGLCLASAIAFSAAARDSAETRATMAQLVAALHELLPLSLDERSFSAPENREAIEQGLATLARTGLELPTHTAPTDASFAFLSRSLERDTRAIQQRFQAGETERARFLLHEVTENCVACHSRLPDDTMRPLGLALVDDATLSELPAIERVRLEVATRQFDRALQTYGELFAGPEFSASDLDLLGHVDGYLEVCLRVRVGDCDPRPALRKLSSRGKVPRSLAQNVESWIASFERLEKEQPLEPSIATLQRLVGEARDRKIHASDRSALVLYFTASGLGNRMIEQGVAELDTLAEVYYWLGLIETRVGRSFWPSEGEYLLEAAIRVAPSSKAAQDAYALYEDVVAVAYSGSAGNDPPPEVRAHLNQLRAILFEAGRLEAPPTPGDE